MADISNKLVISEIGKKTLKEVTEWLISIMKENYLTLPCEKAVELSVKKYLAKHALLTKSKHRQKEVEALLSFRQAYFHFPPQKRRNSH